jgi:hypothetical protein
MLSWSMVSWRKILSVGLILLQSGGLAKPKTYLVETADQSGTSNDIC